jgi:1,4-alpha-glucan branching enzyme
MHDTLRYMESNPIYRRWHHNDMTFGLLYAFSENFVLPLSHDEVVYGKGSLIRKMPGDDWQRFANLRAYFGFMWSHPGKKLLFMGGEIAQWDEWNHDAGIEWDLLEYPRHLGIQRLVRDLNRIYRAEPALYQRDANPAGFRWIVGDDTENSVFAYLRHGADEARPVLAVCNMTPVPRYGYGIGVPRPGRWRELLNSDGEAYGGSNLGNGGAVDTVAAHHHGEAQALMLTLPPLATLYFAPEG